MDDWQNGQCAGLLNQLPRRRAHRFESCIIRQRKHLLVQYVAWKAMRALARGRTGSSPVASANAALTELVKVPA